MLSAVFLILVFTVVLCKSTTCGNLISVDGWRYDLLPLQNAGPQQVLYSSMNGTEHTFQFSICGNAISECGTCVNPGVCQLPSTCNGQFNNGSMDPLVFGSGIQLRYYDGDETQYWKRTTYLTIVCDQNKRGFADVKADGIAPLFSIRMKSQAGCPAHGGHPPSFPFQYQFNKYVYTNDPRQGFVNPNYILDTSIHRKRMGSTMLDSTAGVNLFYNWGDYDQYHNLSCYNIDTTELAVPFQVPMDAIFIGTNTTSIYDPNSRKFKDVETDQWEFMFDGICKMNIWFLSGKAIPVLEKACNSEIGVFFDFKLGQPDGALLEPPGQCYGFQSCGLGWNTCKFPNCCSSDYMCTPCTF